MTLKKIFVLVSVVVLIFVWVEMLSSLWNDELVREVWLCNWVNCVTPTPRQPQPTPQQMPAVSPRPTLAPAPTTLPRQSSGSGSSGGGASCTF